MSRSEPTLYVGVDVAKGHLEVALPGTEPGNRWVDVNAAGSKRLPLDSSSPVGYT